MMRVEIPNTPVKEVQARKTGKPLRLQTGYIQLQGEPHPTKFEFFLQSGHAPYAPGNYELDPAAHIAVQQGNLRIGQVKLRPVGK